MKGIYRMEWKSDADERAETARGFKLTQAEWSMDEERITEIWVRARECGIHHIITESLEEESTVRFYNSDKTWCYNFNIPIIELLLMSYQTRFDMMMYYMEEFRKRCPEEE